MASVVPRQHGDRVPQPAIVDAGSGGLLDRTDLLALLDRAATKRLTLITAPPGSGKTSLLRAWAERSSNIRRVAFVSVERGQQNDERFWSAVLDALDKPFGSSEPAAAAPASPHDVDQLIDRILSKLADHPVVLVIDDLHELRSADALVQLEQLLAQLTSPSRVVLSSRRDPSIRLHELRLTGEVAEIRAGDLRFTERETRELLLRSGITLAGGGASELCRRTEGWAAGLRLAVMSLSGNPDPDRFVAEFSGTDRAIGEYLMAEMLERHPGDVQTMLLRTSVVDRMNGELADLLSGSRGSERMLLELEEANAFVVSLDAERTWFRYHQLLADFLRLELRRTLSDEIPDLHRPRSAVVRRPRRGRRRRTAHGGSRRLAARRATRRGPFVQVGTRRARRGLFALPCMRFPRAHQGTTQTWRWRTLQRNSTTDEARRRRVTWRRLSRTFTALHRRTDLASRWQSHPCGWLQRGAAAGSRM